jgi:hypothetical protein
MNDTDAVMSDYERHRQARAKLSEGNKHAVFDALAAAGITHVRRQNSTARVIAGKSSP